MKRALPALPGLFLALLLTGCGGGDDPEPAAADAAEASHAVAVGDCIAGEVDDEGDKVPDIHSVVDCAEPHVYEILALVDLPAEVLGGETDEEKLANRAELAAPTGTGEASAAKAAYTAFAEEECLDATVDAAGWGSMSLQGVGADDAQLQPVALGMAPVWFSVMPEEEWLDGQTQLVCSARFSEPRLSSTGQTVPLPAATPASSPDDQPLLSHYATQDFPVELRQCELAASDGTRSYLPCDSEHYAEFLFTYDAGAVLGADFVNGVDPAQPTDEQYAALDKVCTDVLGELLPGYDADTFKGLAELGTQGWGTRDAGYYQGQCTVAAKDSLNFNLPAGSLMGTDGAGVEPVPYEG